MTNNSNEEPQKTGAAGDRPRKKATPSVPAAAGRGQRASNTPANTGSEGRKPGVTTEIKPARPASGNRPATGNRPQTTMSARALTRYEKDLRRQRTLVLATIGVVVFVVLVLAFGIWQTSLAPNFETLAEVNGQSVSRTDYNKYRKTELFNQSGLLQQQLAFASGDQQQQLQSQLSLVQDEVQNVQSRPVNQTSLENLVNQIVLEKAAKDKFNISVSDDDVSKYLGDEFKNVVQTATPNPTQALQTATAGPVATQAATFATATAQNVTPLPTATPSVTATTATGTTTPGATAAAGTTTTPGATAGTTPGLTPAATTTGGATTPGATGTPGTATASVSPTATQTSTPIPADKVQQTASANQTDYLKSFRTFTGLGDDDYRKYVAKPQLIKTKVIDKLRETQGAKIGDPVESWKLSHILVADEATARQIYNDLKATPKDQFDAKFVEYARTKSTDTSAAAHNGDLGWVTAKTSFDKDFLAAAMKLRKGDLSEPVKTQFGWHIIYCTDYDPKRPLDATTIQGYEQTDQNGDPQYFTDWLKQQVDAAKPKYNTPPTPAPTATLVPLPAFTPVIPPTNTPVPTTPAATTAAATTAASTTAAATTAAESTPTPSTTLAPTPTK
ncbi:MAG TPA: peptidylprolyl isomerase [Chloroflexia bacterium]|nr:peptidylprolyl isomerase [Chloroflexia bacterium]